MIKRGRNYIFFGGSEEEKISLAWKKEPFYSFAKDKIADLPSRFCKPAAVPAFLYSLQSADFTSKAKEILLPDYLRVEDHRIYQSHSWPIRVFQVTKSVRLPLGENGARLEGNPPYFIEQEGILSQIGTLMQNRRFPLSPLERDKKIRIPYISIRDLVSPEATREEIYCQIENLSLNSGQKFGLLKLLTILYAGNAEEEISIAANLFSRADIIFSALVSVESLPLIHGVFLQKILGKVDDYTFACSLGRLSIPVKKCIMKNISRHRRSMVEKIRLENFAEREGERTLEEILGEKIGETFIRGIFVDTGIKEIIWRKISNKSADAEDPSSFFFNGDAAAGNRLHLQSRPFLLTLFAFSEDSIFIQALESLQYLRVDTWHNVYAWEENDYIGIHKDSILRIPYLPSVRAWLGAGITGRGDFFEWWILHRE